MRLRRFYVIGLLLLLLAVFCPSVGHAGTSFTLTANPNPSNPGQAVALRATGAPSFKVVTFFEGVDQHGTPIGSPVTSSGQGVATTSIATLSPGSHSLVACYDQDNPVFNCTNVVTQVVNISTNLSLTTSANPAGLCQSVTFTATVTGTASGPIGVPSSPTGTVTFFDGTAILTTVPLSRGVAAFTTSTLALGTHTIQARYNPDIGYNGSSAMIQQAVSGAVTVTLASSLNPSTLGQNVVLTAKVAAAPCSSAPPPSAAPTGTVTFFDGTTQIGSGNVVNGTATFQTTALTQGNHNLDALYNGDTNYSPNTSNNVQQVVNPPSGKTNTTTTLSASATTISTSQPVTLTATVAPTVTPPVSQPITGQVQFRDGTNVIGTGTLSNGSASFTASGLTAGSHSLTAVYLGDNNFNTSTSNTVTEIVTGISSITLSANPTTANQGQPVALTATVTPNNAPGSVQFFDGSTSIGQSSLSGGTATLSVSTLTVGPHTLTARYLGDSINPPSTSNVVTVTINPVKQNTNTNLTASSASIQSGQALTLTASVTPSGATGTVTFTDGSTPLGQAQLNNGMATLTTSSLVTVGSHSLSASYAGDTNFNSSSGSATVSVTPPGNLSTTTTLSVDPLSANAGQAVIMGAGVTGPSGGGTVTGSVTFTDNGSPLATVQLTGGSASFQTTSLTPGTHRIVAAYNGTSTFNPSSSNPITVTINGLLAPTQTSLTVNPISSTFGQQVTLNATVTGIGGPPTGTVTFIDGDTTLGTVNLTNGAASFSISTLAVGAHSLLASYSGDSKFGVSSSQPVSVQVGKGPTTTVLSASPTSAGQGQAVVLTAKVSSTNAGTITGTVRFMDGATAIGSPATVTNGTATITTSNLPNGNHTLTAVYSGDTNFLASTSAPATVSIGTGLTATTTALSASTITPAAGQAVTFTATVTPPGATGTVTFVDGATTLGTGTLTASLANATATFTTSSLGAGSHSVTAMYGGDSKFAGSNSTPVTFTIPKTNSTTVLTATPNSVALGQPVALRAVVAPAAATGTVTFLDGATTLGTGTLANGAATFAATSLAGGSHTLTATYAGDASFNASTSAAVTVNITTTPLTNIQPGTLPTAFVGVPYSVQFTVTGGTAPLTWALLTGSVPGLTLSPGGVLSGTPTAATTTPVALGIRVTDNNGLFIATGPTLTVLPLPAPAVSSPTITTTADQPAPTLTFSPAYTLPLTATFSLSFTPNASNLPANYTNPDVKFVGGGTTTGSFAIASGASTALLPAIQVGNVAGTITVRLASLVVAGTNQSVLPANPITGTIVVGRFAPVIVPGSVKIINVTASGFSVFLDGSSTPRDLTSANLTFTAASGATLNGAQSTIQLGPAATTWFSDTAANRGVANGSSFSLTIPFAYSGDTSAIGTVSVTLTNSAGNSTPVSGGR